jgi:hypothetical protein
MKSGTTRFLGIVLFVAMGASALVLGVMSAGKSIGEPLKLDASLTPDLNTNAQTEALLKSKDTDGDGLSDYDELNVYHTSPYIKDSDSDGIPDGTEIKDGTDPNCPKGQDCSVPAPVANAPAAAPEATSPLDTSSQLPVATMGNVAQIRAFLKEQGLTDEVLNAIDDQTLINMYNEALPSANGANAGSNLNVNQ